MYALCTKCNKINFIKFRFLLDNMVLGIGLVAVSVIALLRDLSFMTKHPPFAILIIIIFGYGFINVVNASQRGHYCPNCKGDGTLIALDTPEAIKIIKQHNLTIPDEASQQPTPKTSQ